MYSACIDSPPVGLSDFSQVQNKNVIAENLSTALDLTRVLFRDTEQTNPYGKTTKASLSQKILTITIGKV